MNIRKKLLLCLVIVFLCFIAGLNIVSSHVLMKGFYRIEKQDTAQNVRRVQDAIAHEISQVYNFTGDYSMWDDTYEFIETVDDKYVKLNLTLTTYANAKINILAFMRPSGDVAYAKGFDLKSGTERAISRHMLKAFKNIGQAAQKAADQPAKGLLLIADELMLVAARPIVKSSGEGPSRGLLCVVRMLDDRLQEEIAQLTKVPFKLYPNDGLRVPYSLLTEKSIAVRQESVDTIAGYTVLADIFDKPALVLQVELPRIIYLQGIASRNYLVLISIALFVLFSIVFFIVYNKLISQQTARSETETRFSKIAEATPDAIILSSQTGHIVFWNKAAEAMFGYGREEIIGKPQHILLPGSTGKSLEHEYGTTKNDGRKNKIYELVLCRKDASQFLAEASFARWRQNKQIYFGIIIRDISGRKRAEERLNRTLEELLRSNKELEQFAYIASHDLQEPLRQVYSFTQLLRQRYGGALESRALHYMQHIADGARHMSELVQGLLTYSRVSSSRIWHQPVPCQAALNQALKNLSMSIAETHARITRDKLPSVAVEPLQLEQLFQNLIGNAIKFSREGVAPEVHVGVQPDGKHWQFRVADNGIGIDPEYHEKIFLIFQRLHSRGTHAGTGIGLALCKKIIEQNGGTIWAESNATGGATFCFTLPQGSAP